MKKKILSFFVILALVFSCMFSFSACGKQTSDVDTPSGGSPEGESTEPAGSETGGGESETGGGGSETGGGGSETSGGESSGTESEDASVDTWLDNLKSALGSLGDNTEVEGLKELEQDEPMETCPFIDKVGLLRGLTDGGFFKDIKDHTEPPFEYVDKEFLKNVVFMPALKQSAGMFFATAKVLGDEYHFGKTLKVSGEIEDATVTNYIKSIKQGNHIYGYGLVDSLYTDVPGGLPFEMKEYQYFDFYFENEHSFYIAIYTFRFDNSDGSDKFYLESFIYADSNLDLLTVLSNSSNSSAICVCNAYSKEYKEFFNRQPGSDGESDPDGESGEEYGLLEKISDSLETYTQDKQIEENAASLETDDTPIEVSMDEVEAKKYEIFPELVPPSGGSSSGGEPGTYSDIDAMRGWLYNFKEALSLLGDGLNVGELQDLEQNDLTKETCPFINKTTILSQDNLSALKHNTYSEKNEEMGNLKKRVMEDLKLSQGIGIIFASVKALYYDEDKEYHFNDTLKLYAGDDVGNDVSNDAGNVAGDGAGNEVAEAVYYIKSMEEENHLRSYLLSLEGKSSKEYGYFDFYFETDYDNNKTYFYITIYKFSFNDSSEFVLDNFIYADSNFDLLMKSGTQSACQYVCSKYSEMYEDEDLTDGDAFEEVILNPLKTYTSDNNIKDHDNELEANVSSEVDLSDVNNELIDIFPELVEIEPPDEPSGGEGEKPGGSGETGGSSETEPENVSIDTWLDDFKTAVDLLDDKVEEDKLQNLGLNKPTETCPAINNVDFSALETQKIEGEEAGSIADNISLLKMVPAMFFASAKILGDEYPLGKTLKMTGEGNQSNDTYFRVIGQRNHLYGYYSEPPTQATTLYGYCDFYFEDERDFYVIWYMFCFDDSNNLTLEGLAYADSKLDLLLRETDGDQFVYICGGFSEYCVLEASVATAIMEDLSFFTLNEQITEDCNQLESNDAKEVSFSEMMEKVQEIFPEVLSPGGGSTEGESEEPGAEDGGSGESGTGDGGSPAGNDGSGTGDQESSSN